MALAAKGNEIRLYQRVLTFRRDIDYLKRFSGLTGNKWANRISMSSCWRGQLWDVIDNLVCREKTGSLSMYRSEQRKYFLSI